MTPREFADKAQRRIDEIVRIGLPFERAVKNTVARQATRIFIGGQNSDGGNIGQYSTKPYYQNPNKSPRKGGSSGAVRLQGLEPTAGKTGEHVFKNGKVHRTTYLQGGYKELRNRIGRRIDRVNLTLANDLLSDFCNSRIAAKAEPKKISSIEYVTSIKRKANQLKREGLEEKYGTIFNLTEQERQDFYKTLDFNFRKALQDG